MAGLFDDFLHKVEEIVELHKMDAQRHYCQKMTDGKCNESDMYGSATAAAILYTINKLPESKEERAQWVNTLQSYQNKDTGLFISEGHYSTHTTAFMAGALDLFDEKCLYMAIDYLEYNYKKEIINFMNSLDWEEQPWLAAHLGSGIYASMILTNTAIEEWQEWYFDWLDENVDSEDGLWKKDVIRKAPLFHYIAAAFHYVFNYVYAHRAIPCAEQMLKTCIDGYESGVFAESFEKVGWPFIDYTYTIIKLQEQTGKYKTETDKIVCELIEKMKVLLEAEETMQLFDNLNTLFATVSALAVMQEYKPECIVTKEPLRLVLNKRPFL